MMLTKLMLSIILGSAFTLMVVSNLSSKKQIHKPEDQEIIKFNNALEASKEKIKSLNLHRTDRIFDRKLEDIKDIKEEYKVLKKEKSIVKIDTIKIVIKDTIYLEKTDTIIKRKKLFGIF